MKLDRMQLAAIANAVLVAAGSGFRHYEERTQNNVVDALGNALSNTYQETTFEDVVAWADGVCAAENTPDLKGRTGSHELYVARSIRLNTAPLQASSKSPAFNAALSAAQETYATGKHTEADNDA